MEMIIKIASCFLVLCFSVFVWMLFHASFTVEAKNKTFRAILFFGFTAIMMVSDVVAFIHIFKAIYIG